MNESVQDWYVGEDPGVTVWAVSGPDGVLITTTNNAWTLEYYDTTSSTPETAITPSAHDSGAGSTEWFKQMGSATLDGYWTIGGSGYNFRAYLADADLTLEAGHEYRFVWTVTTPTYDGSTPFAWGKIILVRRGRCLPKK